jgi:hypothetical protein
MGGKESLEAVLPFLPAMTLFCRPTYLDDDNDNDDINRVTDQQECRRKERVVVQIVLQIVVQNDRERRDGKRDRLLLMTLR